MDYQNQFESTHRRCLNVAASYPAQELRAMNALLGRLLEKGASWRSAKRALRCLAVNLAVKCNT